MDDFDVPHLPPDVAMAPPPWLRETPLPFEPESAQGEQPCRRCGRREHAIEAEIVSARATLEALECLLAELVTANDEIAGSAEEILVEATEMHALLGEYEALSRERDRVLSRARERLTQVARERRELEARVEIEQRRAGRLRELARRHATAEASAERRAEVVAAATTSGGNARLHELELALQRESERGAKYRRYIAALEDRLRSLAETESLSAK